MRVRGRLAAVAALVALVALVPWSAGARLPAEGTTLDAPGLLWGPVITDPGLVWQGPAGLELSAADGATTRLAGGAPAPGAVWLAAGWLVLSAPSAMLGGPVEGRLRALPVAHLCDRGPGEPFPAGGEGPSFALSGSVLYAALPPQCLGRPEGAPWQLQAISLRTRKVRSLGAAPGIPLALAAAGGRVALAYRRTPPGGYGQLEAEIASPPILRVLDAGTGRPLWQLPAGGTSDGPLQMDAQGDVIGHGIIRAAGADVRRRSVPYWWAGPWARKIVALNFAEQIVLSEGRLAGRVLGSAGGEEIALVTLPSLEQRVVATFSGTVHVGDIALSGNKLAWSQRAVAEVQLEGAQCRFVELVPPRLASIDLRTLGAAPIAVTGPPAPPHPCTYRPRNG